jgi:Beta-propeller repeat
MLNARFVSARSAIGIVAVTIAAGSGSSSTSARQFDGPPSGPDSRAARALAHYANLPVAFVENHGQTDSRVRYYAEGPRYAFYLTLDEVILSFLDESATGGLTLALRFPGSNPRVSLEGDERAPGEVNYFRGKNPAAWRAGIPRYAQVAYRDVWPGVDLRLREEKGTLKYDFRVRAGAQPADIRLAYAGATGLSLDERGALLIDTAMGTLRDAPPVAYQTINGVRMPVESRYVLNGTTADARQYGFVVGAGYRPDQELIIDPGIEYSTFLGGSSHDFAGGIKVDAAGNAYIVGTTQSPDFPTRPGAFRRTGAAGNFGDVFVSKLNATGTALVYSTFIGGGNFDWGRSIAIDAAGNAYLTGQTKSSNFPTTGGAFDRTFNVDTCPRCGIDQYDAFVTKLNASGSALVYSTFLGGFDIDDGLGIAVDSAGNAYVTGETHSLNFPTTAGAFDRTRTGSDAFVTKLNAAGSALVYSTYLGGSAVQFGSRVAVDAGGNAFVMGSTSSADFPTTTGAFDTTANGAFDVFVTKLNASGSALTYSTFLGGQGFDSGGGLAIDAAGSAYVSGGAGSTDFPTTPGAFDTLPDGSSAFVTKLNPAGSALVYSTVIDGTGSEGANAVALDAAGNAWVTGITNSADFPVTAAAFDPSFNGVADTFVSELSADGSTLLYSTYLGGTQSEGGDDLAVDSSGDVYIAGHTYSMDFPTTLGAFDVMFNGDLLIFWGDAFVTKLATDTGSSTPPAPPAVPDAPALLAPINNDSPSQPITFDWSDVPSAASYVIQIDDSSAFSAPRVREQIVSTSQYVTSDLAATPHFWRVRGVNSAGTPGAWSATWTFTPQQAPPPPTLSTFSTNPSTVVGGNGSSGTVVLSTPAPEGGALISLSSSNPAVASVPATVLAPSISFTATFPIATAPVTASTTVTITAAYNGTTRTATITVTPAAPEPPQASLQSVTLNPSTVVGGSTSQGTITLSSGAPPAGAAVSLSSSNAGVAGVPAGVVVNPGATTATFTASTASVSASTLVTILATYNGTTRTAGLTVTSAAPPPPPPQTVTLTVVATGRSGERVTSSPAGINVSTGTSGAASFASGTSVTLSVSNGRDAIWSGACSSGGDKRRTCTFTLNAAATVTANVQ